MIEKQIATWAFEYLLVHCSERLSADPYDPAVIRSWYYIDGIISFCYDAERWTFAELMEEIKRDAERLRRGEQPKPLTLTFYFIDEAAVARMETLFEEMNDSKRD